MAGQQSKQEQKKKDTNNELVSALLQSPFYPLAYCKVLIQIGHEPLTPFKGKTIFGKEQLYYPNTLTYLRYIYAVEGFTGLYRGLGMKILSQAVGNIVYEKATKIVEEYSDEKGESVERTEQNSVQTFVSKTSKEITTRCCAVVISHPFHVMALRCMAQFVGGELRYSSWNVVQNVKEIYSTEGLGGFFSGLVPRLLFEASTIAITSGLAFLIKSYIIEDKDIDALIDLFSSLIVSSITYPLSLVSTISSVSGSILIAGRPPRMPNYSSWTEVFRHLSRKNELKRGASTFFRIYNPSSTILHGSNGFILSNAL